MLLALFWAGVASAQFIAPATPVCAGSTHFYQVQNHANSTYAWSSSPGGVLSGTIGTGNSVSFGSPGTVTLTVVETFHPSNVSATYTATVIVEAIPNPVILSSFAPDCPPEDKEHDNLSAIIIPKDNDDPCPKACENMTIDYSTPPHAGSTYEWFVSGGTPTHGFGNPISVTWGPAGTGSITVVETTAAGCVGTATTCIEIIPSPSAKATGNGQDLTAGPVYICVGQAVIFHDLSVGGSSYSWDFGDGNTSTEQNPSHVYTAAGSYTGVFIVKNACGCESRIKFTVEVKDGTSPTLGCISTVCLDAVDLYNLSWPGMENCPGAVITWNVHGGKVTGYPNPDQTSATILWDDNDGFINANGVGAIEVTISGCPDVCVFPLWVEVPVLHPTHISGVTNACVGEVYRYSIPYQPGIRDGVYASGVDFDWNISPCCGAVPVDGWSDPMSNSEEIRFNAPGDYTISIQSYYNDLLGCKFPVEDIVVHVLPNLEIQPPLTYMCTSATPPNWNAVIAGTTAGASGTLNWTLEDLAGTPLYSWTGGSVFTFPATTITAAGTYQIHVQSPDYCAGGGYATLQVVDPPTTTGTITGEISVCANVPYVYTTNAVPPPGSVLKWTADHGTVGQEYGATTNINWSNTTPYKVYLWLVDLSAPRCSSLVNTLTVNPYTPSPLMSGPNPVCVNELGGYNIAGVTHFTEMTWEVVGPNLGSVLSNSPITHADIRWNGTAGAAIVRCRARVCGTWMTFDYPVTINPAPSLAVVSPPTTCQGVSTPISISSSAVPTSVGWTFGDGGTGSGSPTSHTYNNGGSFPITATVSWAVCGGITQQAGATIVVNPSPVANLTYPNGNIICLPSNPGPKTLVVSVLSVGTFTYSWSAGATPTGTPGEATVTAAGGYSCVITNTATGCTSVVNANIVGCGSGTGGCTPVNGPLTITSSSVNCSTASVGRTTGPSTFHHWNWGDNTGDDFSTANPAPHDYAHSGYYWVSLFSYSAPGVCMMLVQQQVVVHLHGDFKWTFQCGGGGAMQTQLTDLSDFLPGEAPTSWNWTVTGAGGGTFTTQNPLLTLGAGSHTVTLVVTSATGTCTVVKNLTVPASLNPAIAVTGGSCEGTPFNFVGSAAVGSNPISWAWNFDAGAASSGLQNVGKTFNAPPAAHTAQLTVTNNWGCTATASTTVNVWDHFTPAPAVTPPNLTVCQPGTITLGAVVGAMPGPVTYSWFESQNPGSGIGAASSYVAATSGYYGVHVTDGHACTYTAMAAGPVVIKPLPLVEFYSDSPNDLKTDYCLGDFIWISVFSGDSPGGYTYSWTATTPGGTFTSGGPTMVVNSNSGGVGTYTFTVVVTDLTTNCTNTGSFSCTVHALPVVTISAPSGCPPVVLTASPTAGLYFNWSDGSTGPSMTALTGGHYRVTATDAWGCTDEDRYDIDYIPDLGNLMVGCYEFCEPVKWQAPLCDGCTYDWSDQNGYIGSGPEIGITQSGVYHLLITNAAGCTAYSDDIEINITNADLCHQCAVETKEPKLTCIGTDPVTGWPLFEFSFDYTNLGGTVAGLYSVVTFNSGIVNITDPASLTLNGGGTSGTVTGTIASKDDVICFQIWGWILQPDGKWKECLVFEHCFDLPPCEGQICKCDDLKLTVGEAACINGHFHVYMKLKSDGCDFKVLGATVVAPGGAQYTVSNLHTVYSGGIAGIDGWILAAGTGTYCFTVWVQMADGTICKVKACRDLIDECKDLSPCDGLQGVSAQCLELGPLGRHYRIKFDWYLNAPGCELWAISKLGLVGNLTWTFSGGVFHGTIDYYGMGLDMKEACFHVILVCDGKPKCFGFFCIELPDCPAGPPIGKLGKDGMADLSPANSFLFEKDGRQPSATERLAERPVIAPNPSSETVEARFTAPASEGATLILSDLNGRKVVELPVAPGQATAQIGVSHLPAGIYTLTLRTAEGIRWREKMAVAH